MDKKEEAVNEACLVLDKLPYNELDLYLKKIFCKQYFGDKLLFDVYFDGDFDTHCSLGSLICSLNLPIECSLVRANLVPHVKGKRFYHAFIETNYKGREYVIDTSMARSFPKNIYYELLNPRVFKRVNRDDLFVNKFVLFLKDTLKKPNGLTMEFVYNAWTQYEKNKLDNINNNSLLNENMLKNPKVKK